MGDERTAMRLFGLRGGLYAAASLGAASLFVVFVGWGIGSGNVDVGSKFRNSSPTAHPLIGTIIVWAGYVGLALTVAFAGLVIVQAIRYRHSDTSPQDLS